MEEDVRKPETVSMYVHEGTVSMLQLANKRLLIALIVLAVALVITNISWILYTNAKEERNIEFMHFVESQVSNGIEEGL